MFRLGTVPDMRLLMDQPLSKLEILKYYTNETVTFLLRPITLSDNRRAKKKQ